MIIFIILNFAKSEELERPHIIFILADDLGWNDVQFHGSDEIPTPNIDALASRGIILNNYYVQPICSPSRSALLTGKHPIHTGMQVDVIYGPQPYGLPLNEKILPQYLNELGYTSRIVGKWHQGFFKNEYTPTYRGFNSHFGYWCGHQDYYSHQAEENSDNIGFDMRRDKSLDWNTLGNYSTWLFTDEAVNIINNHNTSTPLFLYLAELAVHAGNTYDPIQAPDSYVEKFSYITDSSRRKFAGVLTALDESVGNVTIALARRGMLQNSIVIFSTDNGGAAGGYNGNCASNWPLKGTKDTLWEGGVRGSAMIWSPLLQNTSRVSDQMMTIIDWLPTLYSAVGGNVSSLGDIDGMDMWDILNSGGTSSRSEILHNIDDVRNVSALRVCDYKIVLGRTYDGEYDQWFGPPAQIQRSKSKHQHRKSELISYLDKFHQLKESEYHSLIKQATVECGPVPANASLSCNYTNPCLYNIREDPCEYYNIADDNSDIVNDMLNRLQWYRSTSVPPANQPDDPAANPKYHGYAWVPWQSEPQMECFK